MSLGFFIVGAVIFSVYVYFLIWSIFYHNKKQQEENYPTLDGMGESIDYDGMGDFSRFGPTETQKRKRSNKRSYKKKKVS
tara:strand:+ start:156 stop:395 length:240 start_codon:yes stop_codon:yes gene_type:complete